MTKNKDKIDTDLELFRDLINKSNDAIFVNDPQTGLFIFANDKACAALGYEHEELLKMRVIDIETTFPDNFSWQAHVIELRQRGSLILEGIFKEKNGATFPVETNVSFVVLNTREYMVAVVRDITERKRIEGAMQLQSEIATNISEGIYLVSTNDLRIVYANPRMEEIFGYDPGEMNGQHVSIINAQSGGDPEKTASQIDKALKETGRWRGEVYNIRKDGTPFWGYASVSMLHHPEYGEVYVSLQTDISERKQVEEVLRANECKYRSLFESANDGIFINDETGFVDCNQRGAEMYGLTREEVIGHSPVEFSPERQPNGRLSSDVAGEKIQAVLSGIPQVFEWQSLHANGKPFDVEITLSKLELGDKVYLQAIVRDIGERKQLEQEILKSQKLESIGTLAGGLAHDFNNLLQGVFGYISMAKLTFDEREKSMAMLEQAEKALHQSVNLTTQLLTFSKGGKPVKKAITLGPVIENSVKFALSGSSVGSELALVSDLWPVYADAGQIGQVIQNIVLNADQAMPEGGTIVIAAKNVIGPNKVHSQMLGKGNYVEISIQDTGIGIPAKHLQKIFDPYFSTKEKGSGLGLATSYSIIKNHDGQISVISELGKGTNFIIYLPAVKTIEETIQKPAASPVVGQRKVLVMDDEDLVLYIAGEMIKALGHDVEFARHGESAIEKYRAAMDSDNPFDIVILDLTIRGGLDGRNTIERMREIDAGVKAIVSSGYSDDDAVADYEKHGFKARLTKPYKLEDLRGTIDMLLSS